MTDIGSLFAQVLSGMWIVFVPVGVAALLAIIGYIVIQSRRSPLAAVGYRCRKRTSPAVAGWAPPAEAGRMMAQPRHDYALRAGLKRCDGQRRGAVSARARGGAPSWGAAMIRTTRYTG